MRPEDYAAVSTYVHTELLAKFKQVYAIGLVTDHEVALRLNIQYEPDHATLLVFCISLTQHQLYNIAAPLPLKGLDKPGSRQKVLEPLVLDVARQIVQFEAGTQGYENGVVQ